MSALNIWVLLTCWFPSYDPILSPGTSAWLQYLLKTAVSSQCFPLEVLPGVCPKKGVPAFVFSSDFSVFSFYPLFRVKFLYCAEICLCHASYESIYNVPVLAPGSSESCHSRLSDSCYCRTPYCSLCGVTASSIVTLPKAFPVWLEDLHGRT